MFPTISYTETNHMGFRVLFCLFKAKIIFLPTKNGKVVVMVSTRGHPLFHLRTLLHQMLKGQACASLHHALLKDVSFYYGIFYCSNYHAGVCLTTFYLLC